MRDHTKHVRLLYNGRADHGPYGTLAPNNRGGRKSRYVAEVFDAALIPRFKADSETMRLLDFGCGTGIFTLKVYPDCRLDVGVDISQRMLGVARRLAEKEGLQIPWIRIDGFQLPFKNGEFNRLVARETLCHVTDADFPRVVKEITRVLASGAKFYLLEQVSESPKWQHHPLAPLVTKRSVMKIRQFFHEAGYEELEASVIRRPRFPGIYFVQFGLVPEKFIPHLARWEVRMNRRFARLKTRRWQNVLFVFEKR
jgi:ubiquinone/menaquinone biosynthesis C-methylase UbiE